MNRLVFALIFLAFLPATANANSRCAKATVQVGSAKGCSGIFGPMRFADGTVAAAGQFQMLGSIPKNERRLDRQGQQLCKTFAKEIVSIARSQSKLNSALVVIMQVWETEKPKNGVAPTVTWSWVGDGSCRKAKF